ncbi:hypothetical protein A5733_09945 [Mycobacterium sp. NS-7484]|nr:hypothetical protein A5733_09945 [Mycobacterium sp. NS-7484]
MVDGEGDVVGDGVSLGAESLSSNSTPEITMAAAAKPVAINASVARRVRYQGTGAGLNDQS